MRILHPVARVQLIRSHTYTITAFHDLIRRPRTHQVDRHCIGRVFCMADKQSKHELKQVLFVESGFGCDQHGQNATKAAVRACRNAIEFNSIPSVEKLVPGGRNGLKLNIKIGTPLPETVDLNQVKSVFPYGQTCFEVVSGGLCCQSGIAIAELGDKNDDMLIAVAAVTVGY